MSTIAWLHLSDWHQGAPDFDRKVVRDKLIDDLKDRAKIDPALSRIDFAVFSGDAAWAGQATEFEAAKADFFDPVLEAVELEAQRLFFVPGNHDIDRDTITGMLPPALQEPLKTDANVQHWLMDQKRRARALEPFEAYHAFVASYTCQEEPAFASTYRMELAGQSVALLGLNSAWMCGRNKDAQGTISDYGHLVLGEPQIHDALAQIAADNLRIVIMHHPFNWLAEFDRNRVEERLQHGADFILCGHQHVPNVQVVRGTGGECTIVPAGAAYDRRIATESRYTNSYNFVRLDLEAQNGVAFLRKWNDRRTRWVEDSDTHPGGCYGFSLPSRFAPAEHRSGPIRVSAASMERAKSARMEAAERRYRELLLESCDIIDLANLPEHDRHMAQRQLDLRRLYVPLRVQVEVAAQAESTAEIWEVLEERRATALRGSHAEPEGRRRHLERVAVGERLAATGRLVVLGDPGAGKTTLTRWIATAYLLRLKSDPHWKDLPDVQTLPDEDWLPIVVRCRDLDASCLKGALNEILEHTLRKAELGKEQAADVQELLRVKIDGKAALLVLDGIDEIVDPAVRAQFCGQVDKIASAHPDLPMIATSRIVGYREMGVRLSRGFEHLTLADLTREEKDDFAHRWCDLTELPERRATAAKELITDIHSSDRIERLTGNPMLLTTMALVKRKVGKLPQRRADLYWEAMQVLLNWRREVDEPLDHREAVPQLEYLAYSMCDRGVQQLREDEVTDLFTQMREEFPKVHAARTRSSEKFLRLLESRTGILVEAGHTRHLGRSVPVLEFRHLTFQEYLAARALVDGRFPNRNMDLSLAHCVAPLAGRIGSVSGKGDEQDVAVVENWREALRLCVAICNDDDVDSVLLAILESQPSDPTYTSRARAVQAALCLADEPNVSVRVAEEIARSLAEHTGPEDGVGSMIRTSLDRTASELAGTPWASTFLEAFVDEFFQRDSQSRGRIGGVIAVMASAKVPEDAAALETWLANRQDEIEDPNEHLATIASLAVMAVAHKRDRRDIAVDDNQFKILSKELIPALLMRLSGSRPMGHGAAWALGKLPLQWQPSHLDDLVGFVSDSESDAEAVRYVSWVLRRERVERAVIPLITHLSRPHAKLRRDVARALGEIGSDRATAALVARLDDDDAEVRREAANALGEIKSEGAVDALVARLDDSDANVRRAATSALKSIGGERAIDALSARLDDDDADIRRTAATALGGIKSERAVEALVARLDDNDADVQQAAASALGQVGGERAVEALVARLDDDSAEMRRVAASALGQIGGERAVEALVARLDDDNTGMRRAAASALGQIGGERAVEALVAGLDEDDPEVRRAAAGALGQIGGERAVEALVARLDDDSAEMRRAAAGALGQIGGERAVEALVARLDDDGADVRRAVLSSLARHLERVDQQLLSRDLDGLTPFLDPREPISPAHIREAAAKLTLSVEEVKGRYAKLAERFGLQLEHPATV